MLRGYLVRLGHPELLRTLLDPDVSRLDVLLNGVHHLALLVHHCRQVLEDRVHVHDVGLQIRDVNLRWWCVRTSVLCERF